MSVTNNASSVYESLGLSSSNSAATTRTIKKSLDQSDFLKLLTTQLQNQDPTKPMDNDQMISQMTSFSSLDSLQNIQSSLSSLNTSMTSNQALQASSLVGRSVLIDSNQAYLAQDGSITGYINMPTAADNVTVTIQNSAGETVRTATIGTLESGAQPFGWDGTDGSGNALPAGQYKILVSGQVGNATKTFDTSFYARVDSVNLGAGGEGISLNLAGLGTVKLSDVHEIG